MIIASMYPFPFYIGHGHDTNFSLIKNGELFSCEEGKITETVMNQYQRIPEQSMLAGFKHFGITAKDVDIWVFGQPLHTPIRETLNFFFSEFKARPYEELMQSGAIHFVDHHMAHAFLGIYGSGFDKGMYLTMDDGGDEAERHDSTWGVFEGNRVELLGKSGNLFGLTAFHNFICDATGYLGNVDNGKVMGLASYGKVRKELYKELCSFLTIRNDGLSAECSLKRTSPSDYRMHKFKFDAYHRYKIVHSPNSPQELKEITKHFSAPDIAATGQMVLEDIALEIISNLASKTNKKKLVCAGGLFQNISLNRRILELGIMDNVYIPSAPNDAGLSLGAALKVFMSTQNDRPKSKLSPFLGPQFSNNEIEKLLKEFNIVYEKSNNICHEVAVKLSKGKIIGWFQGRSELGPRALGARSVLADPRNAENKARINQLLKRRDWFMPYAPSVFEENLSEIFEGTVDSPYMAFAFKVRDEFKDKIPAAVHVDNTSRPNTVNKNDNPKYYQLLKEIELLTSIPVVLNTSFNRHGIATIIHPRQAIEHLLNGCIDVLAIEDFLVFREFITSSTQIDYFEEECFLAIEKILPIVKLIFSNPSDALKMIEKNGHFQRSGITFDLEKKEMKINNDRVSLPSSDREELQLLLLPFIEKHIEIFKKNNSLKGGTL